MAIEVYNTLAKQKQELRPIEPGKVKMYACGPTVYDDGHIGHARAAVVFDVVTRYLEFRGYEVTYVRNYTDVDDKIINRANEEGSDYRAVADFYTAQYEEDIGRLGLKEPDHKPKVSGHMPEIIETIKTLLDKGNAYQAEGNVYFSVESFKDYGKLSGRTREDMENITRLDHDPHKKDELDFALWKASKQGAPSWDSPWGPGRPGWHIECSVMSTKYLGRTFDIHGGGRDLIFPHHENEIAQSEAANQAAMANYWLHNGHVTKDGVKISKSLGNFIPMKELFNTYDPEAVKFFLYGVHYHSPLDFTDHEVRQAERNLERFYTALLNADSLPDTDEQPKDEGQLAGALAGLEQEFIKAMDDDFNTAKALAVFFDFFHVLNQELADKKTRRDKRAVALVKKAAAELRRLGRSLGLLQQDPAAHLESLKQMRIKILGLDPAQIEEEISERARARKDKDFEKADDIRRRIQSKGVVLEDTPEGTMWRVEL